MLLALTKLRLAFPSFEYKDLFILTPLATLSKFFPFLASQVCIVQFHLAFTSFLLLISLVLSSVIRLISLFQDFAYEDQFSQALAFSLRFKAQ